VMDGALRSPISPFPPDHIMQSVRSHLAPSSIPRQRDFYPKHTVR